ncbi:MAG: hypothetical protein CBB68_03325 [Rhodospirillaceae bacterium TMED8]|nr:hypothetical protein [Magnetovibrio sp.]OUT51921.1 MAG: hypothetical protein CBB68_03325 [Rhodospirillaceae bacterium TMED8]
MSLDITPIIPASRQLIQGYGNGGFRIGGKIFEGSVLVFHEMTISWDVVSYAQISVEKLQPIIRNEPDVLLVGCGGCFQSIPGQLRANLRELGVVLEWMDTSAACRTFNVLLAEERSVVAALIAVD